MSDLSTDQPIIKVMAMAEKRSIFFLECHGFTQSLII